MFNAKNLLPLLVFFAACDPTTGIGTPGPAGTDGKSCTVANNGDGTATITCEDGTSSTIGTPEAELQCTTVNHCNGWTTTSCPDGSETTFKSGHFCTPAPTREVSYALNHKGGITGWDTNNLYGALTINGKFQKIYSGNGTLCATNMEYITICWDNSENHPTFELPDKVGFKKVVISYRTICGLTQEGHLKCYENPYSEYSTELPNAQKPEQKIIDIAGFSNDTIVALSEDGSLQYVGTDETGDSPLPSGSYSQIEGGPGLRWGCGITFNGTVNCWGMGLFMNNAIVTPPGNLAPARVVKFTDQTACALLDNGQVRCWGSDEDGQATPPSGETFLQLAGGYKHFCGLTNDGRVVCWGKNTSGQCDVPEELSVAQ